MNKLILSSCVNNYPVVWNRLLPYRHGSSEWLEDKRGLSIGSSEAAAVYASGFSTTVTHSDLRKKLRGEHSSPPSAFLQDLFDQGNFWEQIMLDEVRQQTQMTVMEGLVFEREETIDGVRMVASPDGIIVNVSQSPSTLSLLEIKFRTRAVTAGWPREKGGPSIYLGDTVWCQVQHQMWVTGIHVCIVLAGTRNGDRRAWHVEFCEPYIKERYVQSLKAFIANPDSRPLLSAAVVRQSVSFWKQGTSRSIPPHSIASIMNAPRSL